MTGMARSCVESRLSGSEMQNPASEPSGSLMTVP